MQQHALPAPLENHENGRVSPNQRPPRQGGRTSPNSRRSPNSYYERVTAVRFLMPSTGKRMCAKLNRVLRTKAAIENGVCLCENFLNGHCDNGHKCRLGHVPRQCLWEYLTPTVDRDAGRYLPGFKVRCYTPEMDTYYEIPSEYIFQTQGSEKYVELFNDNGDNFKEKFRLCPVMTNTGSCEVGVRCPDIHSYVADLSHFPCIHTHVATPEAVLRYKRLPATITVRAHVPNTGEEEDTAYSGDDVLRTVGATQYEEAYMRNGTVPSMKMQHCAHFQNKKMCRLGDGCRFLHVVSLALSTPMQEEGRLTPNNDVARSPNDGPLPTTASAPAQGRGGWPQGYTNQAARSREQRNGAALAALAAFEGQMNQDDAVNRHPSAMAPLTAGKGHPAPVAQMNTYSQAVGAQAPAAAAPLPSQAPQMAPPQLTTGQGNGRVSPTHGDQRRSPTRRNNPYVL